MTPKTRIHRLGMAGALIACLCGISLTATAQVQSTVSAPAELVPPADWTPLTIAQLDEMLAPIALYPDALLAQMLAASTYPLEVVMAARWVSADSDLRDIENQGWDPSVAAVARFPDVIRMMDQHLDWTMQLGQAFLYQRADVMNRIQALRSQAWDVGALVDSPEQVVIVEREVIRIVPAQPEFIYVPYYDPAIVYVRPVYGYYSRPVIWFSIAFTFGHWFHLHCDWHHHHLFVHHHHAHHGHDHHGHAAFHDVAIVEGTVWHHDAAHSRGQWQQAVVSRSPSGALPAPPQPWRDASGSTTRARAKSNPAPRNDQRFNSGSRYVIPPVPRQTQKDPDAGRNWNEPGDRTIQRSAPPRNVSPPAPIRNAPAPAVRKPPQRVERNAPRPPSNVAPSQPPSNVAPAPSRPGNAAPTVRQPPQRVERNAPRPPSNAAPRPSSPPQRAAPPSPPPQRNAPPPPPPPQRNAPSGGGSNGGGNNAPPPPPPPSKPSGGNNSGNSGNSRGK